MIAMGNRCMDSNKKVLKSFDYQHLSGCPDGLEPSTFRTTI